MPLPLALPIAWLIGLTFAWTARAELSRSEAPLVMARPFLVALAFASIVFAPVLGYFVAMHGDWAYLYAIRWSRVPSAVDLVLVVAVAAQIPLSFAVAAPWTMARRGTLVLRICVGIAIVAIALCAVASKRLGASASYAQYHGGFGTVPIGKSPLGRGVLLSWVALLAGWGWAAQVLRAPRMEP